MKLGSSRKPLKSSHSWGNWMIFLQLEYYIFVIDLLRFEALASLRSGRNSMHTVYSLCARSVVTIITTACFWRDEHGQIIKLMQDWQHGANATYFTRPVKFFAANSSPLLKIKEFFYWRACSIIVISSQSKSKILRFFLQRFMHCQVTSVLANYLASIWTIGQLHRLLWKIEPVQFLVALAPFYPRHLVENTTTSVRIYTRSYQRLQYLFLIFALGVTLRTCVRIWMSLISSRFAGFSMLLLSILERYIRGRSLSTSFLYFNKGLSQMFLHYWSPEILASTHLTSYCHAFSVFVTQKWRTHYCTDRLSLSSCLTIPLP